MLYSLYISLQPFLQNRDGLPLTSLQPFYKIGRVWLLLRYNLYKIEMVWLLLRYNLFYKIEMVWLLLRYNLFYKIGMVWLHLFKGGNKIEIRLPFGVKQ
jgi:hypothetical protein